MLRYLSCRSEMMAPPDVYWNWLLLEILGTLTCRGTRLLHLQLLLFHIHGRIRYRWSGRVLSFLIPFSPPRHSPTLTHTVSPRAIATPPLLFSLLFAYLQFYHFSSCVQELLTVMISELLFGVSCAMTNVVARNGVGCYGTEDLRG